MERLRKTKIKINDKVGRSASLGIKKNSENKMILE